MAETRRFYQPVACNETLTVAGATTLNGAVSLPGAVTATGGVVVPDDALLAVGTGSDVRVSWDTTDANANECLIQVPAGGAVNVPVIAIGQSIESVDLGLYDGVVDPRVALFGVGARTTGPVLEFRKCRGTIAAPTVVTTGDDLGTLDFYGAVASGEYVRAASIRADMAGTIATTRGPGTLTFLTATDAAPSVLTTAMTISAAQLVTCAAGVTVTTGNVTVSAGSAVLGEATLPAGTNCYIGRDNTGDTNINALTGKTINLQVNGSDIATLSATVLSFTGTIAATGARVTQSYHTNITSTNAVTVDSSIQSKVPESIHPYAKNATAIVNQIKVIDYQHVPAIDPSGAVKLGIVAESVSEPLVLNPIDNPDGGTYPGVNMMGLVALLIKQAQEQDARLTALEPKKVKH